MSEEEFKDFKNYIKQYRNFTNDLVNKCITPYMLEQFRCYNDRFDYEPDLYAKYDVLGEIDNLQQKNQQLKEEIIKYIEQHSNNATEYLDVWEVKELLEKLKGDNKED
jgi:hypothetical protein